MPVKTDKEKALESYEKAKKLFFESKDIAGAITEMQESIRLDDGQKGGERQYQLAKLCILAYQNEGIEKLDATYAILAQQFFTLAREKGKADIKDKYTQPIRDLAKANYLKALETYKEKKTANYLILTVAYLKNALTLGGLPEGDVEYDLSKVYMVWGKRDLAYDYLQKALARGKILTEEDEIFLDSSSSGTKEQPMANHEDLKILQEQLDLTKSKLKEAEERLAITESKVSVKISSKVHEKALEVVKTEGFTSNIAATLASMEEEFQEAKKDPNTFESHIDALKAVGVSPKSLLELASSFTDNTAISQLFWIRKLGDFQSKV